MAGVSFGEQYGDCAGAVLDCGTPIDHSHVLFALDCTKCQSHNFTVTNRPAIIQAYDLSANALATLHMATGCSNTQRLAPVLGKNGLKAQLSSARNRMVVCVPGVYALKWEDCTSRGYVEVKFATKDYEVDCDEGVHAPAQLTSVSREMIVTTTGLDNQTFIVRMDYRLLSEQSVNDLADMLDNRDDINVNGIIDERLAAGGLVGRVGHVAPITDTGTASHPIIGIDLSALDARTANILNQNVSNGGLVATVAVTAPITRSGPAGNPVIGIDLAALDARTANVLNQTITSGGLVGSVGVAAPVINVGTASNPVVGIDIPALVSPAPGNALALGPDGKLFLNAVSGGTVTGDAPILVSSAQVVSIDLAALDARTDSRITQTITGSGLVGSVGVTAPITNTGTARNPVIGIDLGTAHVATAYGPPKYFGVVETAMFPNPTGVASASTNVQFGTGVVTLPALSATELYRNFSVSLGRMTAITGAVGIVALEARVSGGVWARVARFLPTPQDQMTQFALRADVTASGTQVVIHSVDVDGYVPRAVDFLTKCCGPLYPGVQLFNADGSPAVMKSVTVNGSSLASTIDLRITYLVSGQAGSITFAGARLYQ